VVAAAVALLLAGTAGQVIAIALGALGGILFCRGTPDAAPRLIRFPVARWAGAACLVLFAALLVALPLLARATGSHVAALFDAFYRSGALVFGGGHVVLPLLQAEVVDSGWVTPDQFLAGYGAAQAVPGPLFTFAAYLGAVSGIGPGGVLGALIALVAIFLPGFLLLVGVLPFWNALRGRPSAQAVMRGANAAVVGILAAALYQPVFTTAVTGAAAFVLALVCFVLLVSWKLPPWVVVIAGAAGGVVLGLLA
ncbi:MAG: chromate efflux transporter, partial [Comamonadaceae bacterium]